MADRPDGSKLRHDLRTPVNQIIGYSEMLQEDAIDAGQTRIVPDLQKINAAARNLLPLIDRVPDLLEAQAPAPAASAGARPQGDPAALTAPRPRETEPRAPAAKARDRQAPPRGGPATLLVVDDNELNRDMLTRRLERRGYIVLTADDGEQALRMVSACPPDLILLDIMMPGLSGIEVLKILREEHSVVQLPVIMATAMDLGEDIVEALMLGANDYVSKPLDFPVVLARTETQLSLKRAMGEIRRLADELEIRNRFIQQTFGRYLSEEVVASLLETPEGLRLGGEKREVTLLMSDLRGFTSLADRLTPEQVVGLLNNYLGVMSDIITRYQGTIDEFIGDAILALFGAPISRPGDAERAAACAIEMQLAMEGVNAFNRRGGLPEVQMGIAVNTGDVVVGNIGSQTRAKYGVVGSHVNLAGRIESFTIGGQVLVSESTLSRAGASLEVGERITFEAKGFKDPVAVYDLLGVAGGYALALPDRQDTLAPLHRELPVWIAILEGKQMKDEMFPGVLVKASARSAAVRTSREVRPLSNLRLRLAGTAGEVLPGDLYGKVLTGSPDGPSTYRVHFTSVDREVALALEAALTYAVEDPSA